MGKVADIIARKGNQVHSIARDATVFDAVRKMVENNVGALIVLKGSDVFGIITERDYLRRIVLEGRSSKTTPVYEVATERLVCVDPTRAIEDCMAIMTQERIRHLPIIESGKLAGIVSIGDLVKHLTREQSIEIKVLTDYITGKYPI